VKFQRGNPGGPGRPKGSYLNGEAKKWAEKNGIALLLRIAGGREKGWGKIHRWDAIKLALAYGIGKPREVVEYSPEDRPQNDFNWATKEQLDKLIASTSPCVCQQRWIQKPPNSTVVQPSST
jgi:hypothetical protein